MSKEKENSKSSKSSQIRSNSPSQQMLRSWNVEPEMSKEPSIPSITASSPTLQRLRSWTVEPEMSKEPSIPSSSCSPTLQMPRPWSLQPFQEGMTRGHSVPSSSSSTKKKVDTLKACRDSSSGVTSSHFAMGDYFRAIDQSNEKVFPDSSGSEKESSSDDDLEPPSASATPAKCSLEIERSSNDNKRKSESEWETPEEWRRRHYQGQKKMRECGNSFLKLGARAYKDIQTPQNVAERTVSFVLHQNGIQQQSVDLSLVRYDTYDLFTEKIFLKFGAVRITVDGPDIELQYMADDAWRVFSPRSLHIWLP